MFPLGTVALPGVALPLQVFEPRYRALVMTCLTEDRLFGSVLIDRGSEVGGGDHRCDAGSLIRIIQSEELPDGRWAVVGVGVERLRIVEWLPDDPFPRCIAEAWADGEPTDTTAELVGRTLAATLGLMFRLGIDHADLSSRPDLNPDPSIASFQLAALSPLGPLDRLQALKSVDPDSRLRFLLASIEDQIATLDAIDTLNGEDNASQ
ncbi:MAG: LON peptidase substrate-binding domain-containing protein [Actinobacteria bacterium]|nr:LON peptidase substrate-binding domain-containing protein [Actinomycetota bacterium]